MDVADGQHLIQIGPHRHVLDVIRSLVQAVGDAQARRFLLSSTVFRLFSAYLNPMTLEMALDRKKSMWRMDEVIRGRGRVPSLPTEISCCCGRRLGRYVETPVF